MTKALTTAAALTPSLGVTVTTVVRSTMRVPVHSFGVPLRTIRVTHGTAACTTVSVTYSGSTMSSDSAFRCVLLGIKNLDS